MKNQKRNHRKQVQNEVRAAIAEERSSGEAGMTQQGAGMDGRSIWGADLWWAEAPHVGFLLRAVYDVLPCPSNPHCRALVDTPACFLCQRKRTLEHILSCHPKAPGEG